ncbi:MAG: Asp-tRNA(Asn)/Glu-tRNA(Gln) amidotransferase subunit GatA [Spirochaetes bacterium]|nr:Asp-tRNA(Asn)/Glu-tRNA(Gln) amidotransferase subunit GatA [Spirochaetota bacterium]
MQSLDQWSELLSDEANREKYGEYLSNTNDRVNAFSSLLRNLTGPGIPLAVKDNIAVEGLPLTCGSRILGDFASPYTASAVEGATGAGFTVVGKTNLDEFGMGSSTTHTIHGATKNPWDPTRVAGGSSGGSAAAVAAGMVPVALGSDTGGSVRQPAAFCGVYGLKPTYGAVSRYGLVAYASSFDVIGVLARTTLAARRLVRAIHGTDGMDQTSFAPDTLSGNAAAGAGASAAAGTTRPRRVGVLSPADADEAVAERYREVVEWLEKQGIETREVHIPGAEAAAAAYYTIATAEASANLARYNGVRYGRRTDYAENPEELVKASRTEGFGAEVKLRILLGTFVLRSGFQDQYYHRAQAVRRSLSGHLHKLFADIDLLLSPVYPTLPFPIDQAQISPIQEKIADRYTTLANLTRVPAISIPTGTIGGLPAAIQAIGPAHSEDALLDFAELLGTAYPVSAPPDYPGFLETIGAETGGAT